MMSFSREGPICPVSGLLPTPHHPCGKSLVRFLTGEIDQSRPRCNGSHCPVGLDRLAVDGSFPETGRWLRFKRRKPSNSVTIRGRF